MGMKSLSNGRPATGAILALVAVLGLTGCSGAQTQAILDSGAKPGWLMECPESPNCVSSQSGSEPHRVAPLRFDGDASLAHRRLMALLGTMERVRVVHADPAYVHAEFRSAIFGFVDDVEFRFEPNGVIQIRSASRLGYSDFGVNRKRVEAIRGRFAQAARVPDSQ